MVIPRLRARRHAGREGTALEAARARLLIEESPEIVLVVDEDDVVVAASRRARLSLPGVAAGQPIPAELLREDAARVPVVVPYAVDGHNERLVYLSSRSGEMAAYEELRSGFTAAVSHELRTPLARLLVLLEAAELPGADARTVIEQARAEVGQIGELIDDVLFLTELETGREVVSLGSTPACPLLREAADEASARAELAGVRVIVECEEGVEVPLRARMVRVIASNLLENAIRYAGEGATFALRARRWRDGTVLLVGADNGAGVPAEDLPRLFERFYRADRARTSRGTGLGLAIVKHIVVAAGGTVEATRSPEGGLTITCSFPVSG
ncbi:MAG TPA: ATP-binding protein [Gaiellaceae bacterium]|nr:ATP-binding protein [Gaiellaceae bacterium]